MSSENSHDELVRLQTEICQSVLAVLRSDTAGRIGERLATASRGAFIPNSGFASVPMLAAMLGLAETTMETRISDNKPTKYGNGKAALYSLADFLKPKT